MRKDSGPGGRGNALMAMKVDAAICRQHCDSLPHAYHFLVSQGVPHAVIRRVLGQPLRRRHNAAVLALCQAS